MITFEQMATMDISAREMGAEIAAANNEEQCEFFEGLAEGFELFDENGGEFNAGVQMCWIKDNLSQRSKKFIKMLAEYVAEELI